MSDNILEPNINGLPPVTDWQKVFLALQQANEAFLRGATLQEFGKQIIGDVQIQGSDFVDLPVAEDSTPVPLPIPETGNKFGFLADGKFTQPTGGTLEYSATQWGLTLFDGTKWIKKFTLTLPKGQDGQGILPIWSSSFIDPDSGLAGYKKDAQVVDSDGALYISSKENNIDNIKSEESWNLISIPPVSKIIWKCKEFNLNNGSGLVTDKYLNNDGTISNGTGGYLVIPITPNLWEKPIYVDGWTLSLFASNSGVANYAFYDESDNLILNGGISYYGRYNIIPKNSAKILIAVSRLVAPTQAAVDSIKVSISFNRINEEGKDCYITDIKKIVNSVPKTSLRSNSLAFAKGQRTVANISNANFYSYLHLCTPIVELTPREKVLWIYKLTNNLSSYGVIFYDKDWNIIVNSDSIMTIAIPNIPAATSFLVNFNGTEETVFETPFVIPSKARYVVFGLTTNSQLTERHKALTAISSKRLLASDFPITSFEYYLEVFEDIESYKNRYDLKDNEEFYNRASLSKLSNGRFNAIGSPITGGQNVTFDVVYGEVYTVIVNSVATSSSELGFGVYTDTNDLTHALNLSNYSRLVIGNNGDVWPDSIRVYQIIPQNDWKSVSVTTTASNKERFFAIFKGVFDGKNIPFPNDRITKGELSLSFKKYQDKVVTFLGDSITHQMLWQRLITFQTGIAPDYNEIRNGKNGYRPTAVGGTRIYPGLTDGKVTNPATNNSITCRADDIVFYNPDVIPILGGRNDLGKGTVIGQASNPPLLDYNNPPLTTAIAYSQTNENDIIGTMKTDLSFASCYRGMLVKLMQNIPKAKIICLTPIGGNDGPRNLLELKAIRQVILDICADYGIQVIDTYRGVQINGINYTTYAGDGIHPNIFGAKLMGDYIVSQIS